MELKNLQEFITFLQAVQSPSAPMSLKWHQVGTVSVALDWRTFNELRSMIGEESKYSYHDGVFTLEPPRSHFSSEPWSRQFPWSKLALKTSILTHLQTQLAPYATSSTATGLMPTIRTNVGRILSAGNAYRTADIYIGFSVANNLDVGYDSMHGRAGALILDVVVGSAEERNEQTQAVDEWFAGEKEVQQVITIHIDTNKIVKCREKGRIISLKGTEEIGVARRWGQDTKGQKALLEEIRITYYHTGYTDAPVMLVDLARALGILVPYREKLMLVLDWNHALSSINLIQEEQEKGNI